MKLLPPKARSGDRVAILSPSLAAPGFAPAVHEQAMVRLEALTGLVPVEYPTTRRLGASPEERARDINAAFADPSIRAILATVGGDDQIAVIPHLDGAGGGAVHGDLLGRGRRESPASLPAAARRAGAGSGGRALWRATGVKDSDLVPSPQEIPPFSPPEACRLPHAAAAMAR